MKLLILGYGMLGKALVPPLQEVHEIIVASRQPVAGKKKFTFLQEDMGDLHFSGKPLQGIDLIIHTAHGSVPYTSNHHLAEDLDRNVAP